MTDPLTAVVFGASSGIGRATAHLLADGGARLVLVSRDAGRLAEVSDECREVGAGDVVVRAADISRGAEVEAVLAEAVDRWSAVDLVVQSAAVMAYGRVEDLPAEVFERVVDVTVKGTANVARATLPRLRAQDGDGTLVIVTSLLASVAVPTIGAYITAKWAQLGLARTLQLEVRDDPGVHVCTVAPGAIDTPIYRHAARFGVAVPNPPPPVDPPEKVARAIVGCVRRPARSRNVGLVNRVVVAGFRGLPFVYDALVGPLFRRTFSGDRTEAQDGNVFSPGHDDDRVGRP